MRERGENAIITFSSQKLYNVEMERPPNAICSIVLLRGRWSSMFYQIQAMTGKLQMKTEWAPKNTKQRHSNHTCEL